MKAYKLGLLATALVSMAACGDDKGASKGSGRRGGEGACTNDADMAIIEAASVDGLGCEGAKCAIRSLATGSAGAAFGLDSDEVAACLGGDAPTVKQLSAGCQECFAAITECVPYSCVMLFGGSSDACNTGGIPSDDFSECTDPPATNAPCAECQKPCQAEFVACSGLSP